MAFNKANVLKVKKNIQASQYARKMQELSVRPREYDVVAGDTIITRCTIEQCARYGFGYKFIPVGAGT